MLPVKVAGLGWYLPERRVTNDELAERVGVPAAWIERASGVRERRYVGAETSAGMGAAAAVLTRSGPGEASAIHHARFETYSSGADLTQIVGGGTLHHPNDPTTTPEMSAASARDRGPPL